jgi:next-to-BRCA1 protein 1
MPSVAALHQAAVADTSAFRLSSETLTPQVAAPVSPVIARSPEAPKFEAVNPVLSEKPAEDGEAPVPKSFATRQGKCCLKLLLMTNADCI